MADKHSSQDPVTRICRPWLLGTVLALGSSLPFSHPVRGDDMEHQQPVDVRQLRSSGEILSLDHFIHQARTIHPGRVIDASLEYEYSHGRYVYEVEILDPRGEVWELEFDAHSGQLLERGRGTDIKGREQDEEHVPARERQPTAPKGGR